VIVMAPIGRAIGYHNVVNSGLAAVTYVMDIYAVFTGARNGGFFAHTWSLAVEEQFYLVWPTLLLFTLRRRIRGPWVAVVIGIAAALVTEAVQVRAPDQIGRLLWTPFPYLPTIAAGVLLAFALSTETGRQPLRFFARPLLPAAVMVGLVIASFEVQELARWLYLGGYVIIAILFTALVGHVVLAPESGPSRLLSAKPVVWLGTRSYGFYIWHYPIVLLMRHDLHETWLRAAVVLLISLVVTELSWRLVEQPFLRLKNRRFEPPNVVGNSDPTSVRKTSTP
jgi:peptidoglycan/LPS O-acetylase OafA/YrhL